VDKAVPLAALPCTAAAVATGLTAGERVLRVRSLGVSTLVAL